MGNRVYQRVGVEGLNGDISDGAGFFPGVITDVSRFGMCMVDLPRRVNENTKRMNIVVSGHGKNFKMIVRPRWSDKSGMRKMVGFEILNTPWEWTDFVMNLEPREDRHIWDVINL